MMSDVLMSIVKTYSFKVNIKINCMKIEYIFFKELNLRKTKARHSRAFIFFNLLTI